MILSFILFIADQAAGAEQKKAVPYALLLVAVVLSLLAGFRDFSVGTDTAMYANRFTTISGMSDFLQAIELYGDEPGYLLSNYLIGRFTGNPHVYFFILALVTHSFVIKALYDHRAKINMTFGFLVYLLVFYQLSFNYLRQCVAMAIFFYALKYFPGKKLRKILLWTTAATAFHYSGVTLILLYALYRLFTSKYKRIGYVLVYGGLMVFFIYFKEILVFVMHLVPPLNKPKYLLYIQGAAGYTIGYLSLMIKAPIALFLMLFHKELEKRNPFNLFLVQMVLLDLVFSQIGQIAPQSHRISLYAEYAKMLVIPQFTAIFRHKAYRWAVWGLTMLYLIAFWYIFFIYKNYNHTYPFIFSLTY
ncbi:MAG: EpsG family protein [Clostridia bacterium]|nr:EpsG family protein [Clostridia bacterium]